MFPAWSCVLLGGDVSWGDLDWWDSPGKNTGVGREMRAFFSCMAWRGILSPLSKHHRRLDSLQARKVPRWGLAVQRMRWLDGMLASGLHARGEGERVLALESREWTRASRRVEEGLSRSFSGGGGKPSFPSPSAGDTQEESESPRTRGPTCLCPISSTPGSAQLYEHDGMHRGPIGSSRLSRGQRLVPLRWGCALPSPTAPGKAPNQTKLVEVMEFQLSSFKS